MASKPSKSESRLQRQIEKQLRQKDKNARLAQSVNVESKPIRVTAIPEIDRLPRTAFDELNYKDYALSWGVSHADTDGDTR